MKFKITIFLTAMPFILFILQSQTHFSKINDKNIKLENEVAVLKSELNNLQETTIVKMFQSAEEAKKKALDMLDQNIQIYKKNEEFRIKLLKELAEASDTANKYVEAYAKNIDLGEYGKMELIATASPKKRKQLESAIENTIRHTTEEQREKDIELKKHLYEAKKALHNIKNNF